MTVSADGGTWCRWASHHHMPHRVQHIVEEGEQARSQVSQLARWVGLADAHLGHPPCPPCQRTHTLLANAVSLLFGFTIIDTFSQQCRCSGQSLKYSLVVVNFLTRGFCVWPHSHGRGCSHFARRPRFCPRRKLIEADRKEILTRTQIFDSPPEV